MNSLFCILGCNKKMGSTEAIHVCLLQQYEANVFQMLVPFILGTADVNDFQQVVNATVILGNSNIGADSCFRIVIIDDSDPEPAENFTISFVVNMVQPEGVNISVNQRVVVITIQESDRKKRWC